MMLKMETGEASCAPTQHVGFDLVHSVPPRSRPKPADRFPAAAAIDFCRSANVELRIRLNAFKAVLDVANDAATDTRWGPRESIAEFRIRSVMCAPLWTQDGKAFGVMQLDTQDRVKKFTEEKK